MWHTGTLPPVYLTSAGADVGHRLPPSVAGAPRPSAARQVRRSAAFDFYFGFISHAVVRLTAQFSSLASARLRPLAARRIPAERVPAAAALAAAAPRQPAGELQAAPAHVWPGGSRCARHAEKDPWAEREWRCTHMHARTCTHATRPAPRVFLEKLKCCPGSFQRRVYTSTWANSFDMKLSSDLFSNCWMLEHFVVAVYSCKYLVCGIWTWSVIWIRGHQPLWA